MRFLPKQIGGRKKEPVVVRDQWCMPPRRISACNVKTDEISVEPQVPNHINKSRILTFRSARRTSRSARKLDQRTEPFAVQLLRAGHSDEDLNVVCSTRLVVVAD